MEAIKNILIGSHARYTGTGSAGEIINIRTDEEGTWAKIDTTELWYNSQFLEVIDEKEYQRIKSKEKILSGKEKVKKEVSFKKKLEEIDMSSELCDGGG
ncbi:MAG: DUF2098 domain-containing protein [Methanobacterium sp.]